MPREPWMAVAAMYRMYGQKIAPCIFCTSAIHGGSRSDLSGFPMLMEWAGIDRYALTPLPFANPIVPCRVGD